ncbi:Site-specific DNA recombinase [Lachnospiraceae bacterium XBB1006]|nr:Site-specific DNA recombinase [Lachnospiraceae bacterium XBB1006]
MARRVAIYARVSTEHEAQISALENQVQYYDDILSRHKDWTLVDRYIDEGITGTSIHKREAFMRMLKDAKDKKFDLIVTREVSRFARNTVDTLQQTRTLKTYGVEVWFTEDNIWTLNDEDGELRLSIMATLAQNESKKISQRVKAGQMISFKNGVLYGNGNILGYDRVGSQMVVNKEQAQTVKRIYELYLAGNGIRKIQYIMEQEGRLTATGLTRWQASNVLKVLKNPFYCGRIVYRKQYVPDYLTQKKIKNDGAVEKVYVEGSHEKLISPEDFDRVQELRQKNQAVKPDKNGRKIGHTPCKNIWGTKCTCTCGYAMNRRVAHKNKNGKNTYIFQCYKQLRTGTPSCRLKKGLDIEGICDNSSFMEWKLEVQADFVFKKLLSNKEAIYQEAMAMAQDVAEVKAPERNDKERLEQNQRQIEKFNRQLDNLVSMCADGDISREVFRSKKKKLEDQIMNLEKLNDECRQRILELEDTGAKDRRIESLSEFIKMAAFDSRAKIPETVIDNFVDQIVYDHGVFIWYLNPAYGNEVYRQDASDWKKKQQSASLIDTKAPLPVGNSTGSYRRVTSVKDASCFLGTFEISKEFMRQSMRIYHPENTFHFPEKLEIKLFLV